MLTQAELKSQVYYNQDTGIFTRLVSNSPKVKVGSIAGGLNNRGYIAFRVNSKIYTAHRLAWLYVYGEFPKNCIDHINGIKSDNRLVNLRNCTQQENCFNRRLAINNKAGIKGICFDNKTKKWRAQISIDGKRKSLGYFKLLDDAKEAVKNARELNHKQFARHE